MNAPKCPKAKAVFRAVAPDGSEYFRSSARDYSHAVAMFSPAEPNWDAKQWIHLDRGEVIPEGSEVLYYGRRDGGEDRNVAFVGRRVADLPDRWSVWSFHGSAALAEKAGRSYVEGPRSAVRGHRFQVIPAEVVADRRMS